MPENEIVAKSYIGKDIREIMRINGLDDWTAVIVDDEIVDMVPIMEDYDVVYQSVLGYTINPHTDLSYDDTKDAYEMRQDYMTCGTNASVKPSDNFPIKAIQQAEKREKETIELDVSYAYKVKINRKYLENMISDGITTGSFGRYTDFIEFVAPNSFEGEAPRNASEKIMKGWRITVCDAENKRMAGVISLKTVMKAIQTMALKYPHLYCDAILKEDYDAISASALLEIATFRTIVYG